jgi:hypothetical protein
MSHPMDLDKIPRAHSKKLVDDLRAEKLRRAFAVHAYDGSECHAVISQTIPFGHAAAAKRIKEANDARYANTIPTETAIELVLILVEKGEIQ